MSASPELSVSTLQHVTKRKLERLTEHIDTFSAKKKQVIATASQEATLAEQLSALLKGAKDHSFNLNREGAGKWVANIERYLAQAEYDSSVSQKQIGEWKQMVEQELEVQGHRYRYASLFGKLCNEWSRKTDVNATLLNANELDESGPADDDFVDLGRKEAVAQREEWEKYAFTESVVDTDEIEHYLEDLFDSTATSKKVKSSPLHDLRTKMASFDGMEPKRFTGPLVAQSIDGLLSADFFSGTKRKELVEMKGRPEILEEIADVLNMDLDSIESWQWEKPIPLHQRRQLNGKYRVYHNEEIHQAIFVQFIGKKWAVFMREAFTSFFHSSAWKQTPHQTPDRDARQRREYFFGSETQYGGHKSLNSQRRKMYESEFFMLQLPSQMDEPISDYDNTESPIAPTQVGNTPVQKKDLLHRLITTEMQTQTSIYGSCTILQSDFKWFGPSIPHASIFAVMAFLGAAPKHLDFFRRLLESSVFFADDTEPEIKKRKRGIPMSHILSDALGEAILFCLDFAVNKVTGGADLYRFHDDLWVWGQEETCIRAWKTMKTFSETMGLELNMSKTASTRILSSPAIHVNSGVLPGGTVTWGLLNLDPKTATWIPDNAKITAHIEELARQLAACDSIFAWTQAWDSYAARFLSRNLGTPALCFGTEHVDMCLSIFKQVQTSLFGPNGSVHEHLRSMLAYPARGLDVGDAMDIPNGFFYFPLSLGGLELRNPFIPLLAVRASLKAAESARFLERACEEDEEDWEMARERFESGSYTPLPTAASAKYTSEPFPTLAEYVAYREETSPHLLRAYERLLAVPEAESVECTNPVNTAIFNLTKVENSYDPYWRWVFELYGHEIMEKFGGLGLGEKSMLPLGMVAALKSERVRWLA